MPDDARAASTTSADPANLHLIMILAVLKPLRRRPGKVVVTVIPVFRPGDTQTHADAVGVHDGYLSSSDCSMASSSVVRSVSGGRTGPEPRPMRRTPALMIDTA